MTTMPPPQRPQWSAAAAVNVLGVLLVLLGLCALLGVAWSIDLRAGLAATGLLTAAVGAWLATTDLGEH